MLAKISYLLFHFKIETFITMMGLNNMYSSFPVAVIK